MAKKSLDYRYDLIPLNHYHVERNIGEFLNAVAGEWNCGATEVYSWIKQLTPRQEHYLYLRYLWGMRLNEIQQEMGIASRTLWHYRSEVMLSFLQSDILRKSRKRAIRLKEIRQKATQRRDTMLD